MTRVPAPSDHAGDTFAHDELCLEVVEQIARIADTFYRCDLPGEELTFELEAPIGHGFADVLILLDGKPFLCVEVKTSKDKQHPGSWLRQVKFYSNVATVPVVLVVAHDLTDLQVRYLRTAKMPVIDLRTLEFVVEP